VFRSKCKSNLRTACPVSSLCAHNVSYPSAIEYPLVRSSMHLNDGSIIPFFIAYCGYCWPVPCCAEGMGTKRFDCSKLGSYCSAGNPAQEPIHVRTMLAENSQSCGWILPFCSYRSYASTLISIGICFGLSQIATHNGLPCNAPNMLLRWHVHDPSCTAGNDTLGCIG